LAAVAELLLPVVLAASGQGGPLVGCQGDKALLHPQKYPK